jgi:uncharacterized protein YwqG
LTVLPILVVVAVLGLGIAALVAWAKASAPSPEEVAKAEAAAREFLASHQATIEATRRPVVRIALSPMAADDPCASKVGGTPWWPVDEPLPTDAKGRPLALLAQVDLAELPRGVLPLPGRGLLQWWVSPGWSLGQDYSLDISPDALARRHGHRLVLHADAGGPARGVPLPAKDALPMDPTRPRRMAFTAGSETMGFFDWRFDELIPGGIDAALEAFATPRGLAADALGDALGEIAEPTEGHKLGGYPHFTQDDARRGRPDLELLFQLDTDAAMMWGDAGVGTLFITDDDLARRDFSRLLYSWDCY